MQNAKLKINTCLLLLSYKNFKLLNNISVKYRNTPLIQNTLRHFGISGFSTSDPYFLVGVVIFQFSLLPKAI